MPFIGTIINFFCIVVFSLLGSLVKCGIPERVNRAILSAVAICAVYLGIDGAMESSEGYLDTFFSDTFLTKFVIIIVSLSLGTAIGELIDIDKWVNKAGERLERLLVKDSEAGKGNFAQGMINCTLIACVGAMSVNGAILDAQGDPGILIAKSVMDAISCFIMASSLGIGCAFSAIPMLVYQGGITALTLLLSSFIPETSIYYLSATGSLIIVLLGTNILGATSVKTVNMVPSVFIPLIIVPILQLF